MSAVSPDEAAGRRVDQKVARSNARLEERYSATSSANQTVSRRAEYLRAQVLRPQERGTHAH